MSRKRKLQIGILAGILVLASGFFGYGYAKTGTFSISADFQALQGKTFRQIDAHVHDVGGEPTGGPTVILKLQRKNDDVQDSNYGQWDNIITQEGISDDGHYIFQGNKNQIPDGSYRLGVTEKDHGENYAHSDTEGSGTVAISDATPSAGLSVLFSLTENGGGGESYKVKGYVKDSETGDSINGVNIALKADRDGRNLGGSPLSTDSNGYFESASFTKEQTGGDGKIYILIKRTGYASHGSSNYELTSPVTDLGTIELTPEEVGPPTPAPPPPTEEEETGMAYVCLKIVDNLCNYPLSGQIKLSNGLWQNFDANLSEGPPGNKNYNVCYKVADHRPPVTKSFVFRIDTSFAPPNIYRVESGIGPYFYKEDDDNYYWTGEVKIHPGEQARCGGVCLCGRVVDDSNGQPIAGADIKVDRASGGRFDGGFDHGYDLVTTSNESGYFAVPDNISAVKTVALKIEIEKSGYEREVIIGNCGYSAEQYQMAGEECLNMGAGREVRLKSNREGKATISGRVIALGDSPTGIEGVHISIDPAPENLGEGLVTESGGRFSAQVEAGTYEVSVFDPRYREVMLGGDGYLVSIDPGNFVELTFILKPVSVQPGTHPQVARIPVRVQPRTIARNFLPIKYIIETRQVGSDKWIEAKSPDRIRRLHRNGAVRGVVGAAIDISYPEDPANTEYRAKIKYPGDDFDHSRVSEAYSFKIISGANQDRYPPRQEEAVIDVDPQGGKARIVGTIVGEDGSRVRGNDTRDLLIMLKTYRSNEETGLFFSWVNPDGSFVFKSRPDFRLTYRGVTYPAPLGYDLDSYYQQTLRSGRGTFTILKYDRSSKEYGPVGRVLSDYLIDPLPKVSRLELRLSSAGDPGRTALLEATIIDWISGVSCASNEVRLTGISNNIQQTAVTDEYGIAYFEKNLPPGLYELEASPGQKVRLEAGYNSVKLGECAGTLGYYRENGLIDQYSSQNAGNDLFRLVQIDEALYLNYPTTLANFWGAVRPQLSSELAGLNEKKKFTLIINSSSEYPVRDKSWSQRNMGCFGYPQDWVYLDTWALGDALSFSSQPEEAVKSVLAYEYGHLYLQNYIKSHSLSTRYPIERLLDRIYRDDPATLDLITNQEMANLFSINRENSSSDLFARFFEAYFRQHARLKGIIRYSVADQESQNTLKFVWNWFAKNVGEVDSYDDQVFPSQNINSRWTPEEIAQGQFLRSYYQSLSPVQKAKYKLGRLRADTGGFVSGSANWVRQKLAALNNWITRLWRREGVTAFGTLKGKVWQKNGQPYKQVIVMVAGKSALTNREGEFQINNLPAGKPFWVNLKDRFTGQALTPKNPPDPSHPERFATVKIWKDHDITRNYRTNQIQKLGLFKGRVIRPQGAPYRNVRVEIAGQIKKTDSQGWFNFGKTIPVGIHYVTLFDLNNNKPIYLKNEQAKRVWIGKNRTTRRIFKAKP